MGHSHTDIPRNKLLLNLPERSVTEAGERHQFDFPISLLNKSTSYLLRLVKDSLKISERGSRELPKDLPEELLGVDGGAAAPVLPPRAGPGARRAGLEAGRAVGIVLLPLHLVTQHLGQGMGLSGHGRIQENPCLCPQTFQRGLTQLSVTRE